MKVSAELARAQKPEAKKSQTHFPKLTSLKFLFTIFYPVLFEFQFLLMGFICWNFSPLYLLVTLLFYKVLIFNSLEVALSLSMNLRND